MAARNVLVGEGEKCKVTDFGMARNVQQDDIYNRTSRVSVKNCVFVPVFYNLFITFAYSRVKMTLSCVVGNICCYVAKVLLNRSLLSLIVIDHLLYSRRVCLYFFQIIKLHRIYLYMMHNFSVPRKIKLKIKLS